MCNWGCTDYSIKPSTCRCRDVHSKFTTCILTSVLVTNDVTSHVTRNTWWNPRGDLWAYIQWPVMWWYNGIVHCTAKAKEISDLVRANLRSIILCTLNVQRSNLFLESYIRWSVNDCRVHWRCNVLACCNMLYYFIGI